MISTDERLELDDVIRMVAKLSANNSELAKLVLGLLLELKDRRESDLKPISKFTQGLNLNIAILNQLKHIESEVEETKYEINSLLAGGCRLYSTPAYLTALEVIDIQTSCESLLRILGYNEGMRRGFRKEVIKKNAERGYYEE